MKRWMFVIMLLMPIGAQSSDWAHDAINLTHEYGDGSGVKVGVLDMLARCTHQELAGRCHNWTPVGYEDMGYGNHATHISSIIAGKDKAPDFYEHDGGVAPGAFIINYGIFESNGNWTSDEIEVEAANHAVDRGVSVINQSYGIYNEYGRAWFAPAVVNVWQSHKNVTFVYAAGNEGTLIDGGDVKGIDNVIMVGATDETGRITYWSNRPGNNYKDQFIVAPGDFISGAFGQSDNDYGWMSGTSMAAPMVTGAVALLHDRWGHLKKDPEATAQILYESATDLGEKGVDKVYGHGMLNIAAAMSPIPIDEEEEEESCHHDHGDEVDSGSNNTGNYTCGYLGCFGTRGNFNVRSVDSSNRVSSAPHRDAGVDVRLERIQTNRVVFSAASQLDVVFFDKFQRDFKTNVAQYKSLDLPKSNYMALSDEVHIQMTNGSPNFKVNLSDVVVGHGKSFGFNRHPVLDTLDDGVYVTTDKVGVMYSDTSTTGLYKPQDWLTLTYTDEKGFLGSSGGGAFSFGEYQTASATLDKDYGLFFGSVTAATSVGDGGRGVVRMSDTVNSVAFNAGIKGTVSNSLNWKFSVGQDLQPIDGRMSVSYIDYSGRSVLQSVELDENRRTKFQFNLNYTW